jgi:hypothetical protein
MRELDPRIHQKEDSLQEDGLPRFVFIKSETAPGK